MPKITHPNGLSILIFTGFWERFSFYGTLTVLLLYLTKVFLFTYPSAYATWGAFIALGYITPALGGLLADYVLGFERTLIVGSIIMILGYILLGFAATLPLYLGLSLALCGSGLFKGSISSLVGMLYVQGDIKRHDAYSQYFMGMSLGAILGPFVFGLIIVYGHWHFAFLLSALGNLLGLLIFIKRRPSFEYKSLPKTPQLLNQYLLKFIKVKYFLVISLFIIIPLVSILFAYPLLGNNFMAIASISVMLLTTLFMLIYAETDAKKIIGLMLLNVILIFYYAAIFQINGSVIVGIEKEFKLNLLGFAIPATTFASLQATFAILLTPILLRFWSRLNNPTLFFKIGFGLLFAGIGYAIFSFVFFQQTHPLFYIVLANLFFGLSTATIFPIHVFAVSHYAPTRFQGTLMGISYLSDSLGGFIGSNIIKWTLPVIQNTNMYTNMYFSVAILVFCLMILWLVISPGMRYLLDSK